MKLNHIFPFAAMTAIVLLFSVGCKKDNTTDPNNTNNTTPTTTADFIEVSIDSETPIRYETKVLTSAEALLTRCTRSTNSIFLGGLKYNPTTSVASGALWVSMQGNTTNLQAATYPTANQEYLSAMFSDKKIIGNDTIVESVGLMPAIVPNPNNYIKIDETDYKAGGIVRGSFYFEQMQRTVTKNNIIQSSTTTSKIRGTFRLKWEG